nr:hypothetical protein ISGA_10020 [Gordonia sp. NB41Y]
MGSAIMVGSMLVRAWFCWWMAFMTAPAEMWSASAIAVSGQSLTALCQIAQGSIGAGPVVSSIAGGQGCDSADGVGEGAAE